MKIRTKKLRILIGMLLMLIALCFTACGPTTTPTSVVEYMSTQVAGTLQAQSTAEMAETLIAQMTLQAMPTNTPTPTLTPTPIITPTLVPTATSQPTTVIYVPPAASATPASTSLCLHATLISDGNIPDGTEIDPNKEFIKTWTFKNTGTCTWTTEFDILFVSGEQMSANSILDFPQTVKPGETVTISVQMVAPSAPRTYTGYWNFADQGGKRFGIGTNGTDNFYVKIVVK